VVGKKVEWGTATKRSRGEGRGWVMARVFHQKGRGSSEREADSEQTTFRGRRGGE